MVALPLDAAPLPQWTVAKLGERAAIIAGDFDWNRPAILPVAGRGVIEPAYFTEALNRPGDRSAIAATVINHCMQSGWTPEATFDAMTQHGGSVTDRYASEKQLRADIHRLWIKPNPNDPEVKFKAASDAWLAENPQAAEERAARRGEDKAAHKEGRWPLTHIRDRATALSAPDPIMLVESIIPDRKLIMPWGDTGCGKTYWSLEVATAVAMRRPAFGKYAIVKPAPAGVAVIFAGEDCDYIDKSRLTVIETQFGQSLQGLVYTVGTAIPINDPNLFNAYQDELRRLQDLTGKPIDIVVNDTLKRSLGLLKQNDDDTGRKFTFAMEGLIEEFGCPILCNAHQPKSGADGAIAGSGDFTANCPVTPHLIGEKDGLGRLVSMECRFEPKFRVGPAPAPFAARAVLVTLPKPVGGVTSDLVLVALTPLEQAQRVTPAKAARLSEQEDRRTVERVLSDRKAQDLDTAISTEYLAQLLAGDRHDGETENDHLGRRYAWKQKLDNGARRPAGNPTFAGLFAMDNRGDASLAIRRPVRRWFAAPTEASPW
jgi:hypothetical protein